MAVFVNRTLNIKRIKVIGFDMDYTLVGYDTRDFEKLTHSMALKKLAEREEYDSSITALAFDFDRAIVGLVVDKRNGNLLQLSRYNKVKASFHGLKEVPFGEQNRLYSNIAIDLSDKDFQSLDTSFAISYGVLFSQLVDLKEKGVKIPDYRTLANDIHDSIDEIHRDGSLKKVLVANFSDYVIQDPKTALMLERFKDYGKKLMIITNSDYAYSKSLLDYAINPYLKKHASWQEVFDIVITLADKPKFFERPGRFLSVDPETGLMSNHEKPITDGVYQGGWYRQLQHDLGIEGNEILYIGDHIYGDVVSIKKQCSWRTALVLGDLEEELKGLRKSHEIQCRIDALMAEKAEFEKEINTLDIARYTKTDGAVTVAHNRQVNNLYKKMDQINGEITDLIYAYRKCFNPYWGEILRAGSEESLYAEQVEEYACIYMTKVSDLADYSPRTYFRPIKRIMPHELTINDEMRKDQT